MKALRKGEGERGVNLHASEFLKKNPVEGLSMRRENI